MGRRRKLLVPEAREAMDQLMHQVMTDKGAPPKPDSVQGVAKSVGVPYNPTGDNGELTTRQAGKIGGQIGGTMIQKLVSLAQQDLAQNGGMKHGKH